MNTLEHRSLRIIIINMQKYTIFTLFFLLTVLDSNARKPNIIFVLADDLGYNELGCYGQKWIKTPHIDKLAADGIKFTQHYSGQAVCAPCRCILMTGKHSGHAYIRDNGDPKDGSTKQFPFPGQNPIPDIALLFPCNSGRFKGKICQAALHAGNASTMGQNVQHFL